MRVTLAIHTYRYAIRLKRVLEQAGIQVWLRDVNTGSETIDENKVYAGIRVRIDEKDLPQALHLVEQEDLLTADAETGRSILVPIDFSRRGMAACLAAAKLALRGKMNLVLLHACPTPYFQGQLPTAAEDNTLFDNTETEAEVEIEDVQQARIIQNNANVEMKRYLKQLREYCTSKGLNELPPIITEVREGVPEEVIAQYYTEHSVALVVMSTRDTETRTNQLIGSVTAEVVDNARISVLTIPDVEFEQSIFSRVMMFCNLDQVDLLLADYIERMACGVQDLNIILVPVNERAVNVEDRVRRLAQNLSERYPDSTFTYLLSPNGLNHNELKSLIRSQKVTMVALANKRRNILSRIFNPGLAHKVLFTNDVPMFALSTDESV